MKTIEVAPAMVECDLTQLAKSRAQVYGVLSAVNGGLPAEKLVELLSSWSLSGHLSGALPIKMKRGLRQVNLWLAKHGSEPTELVRLETEFTRLFRGLGRLKSPPPPYESVYADSGLVNGPSTQLVTETYRRYEVVGRDNELPDYIALELAFMGLLCEKEAQARQTRNGVHKLVKEERDFLRDHLAKWVPAFCQNVRRFNTTSFYAGLADITEGWILCDRRIVRDLAYEGDAGMSPTVTAALQ